jgi:dihydrofolate reductase
VVEHDIRRSQEREMRTLTYFVAVSVDGFIADAAGAFDAFPMQGPHIDAIVAEYPETLPGPVRAQLGLDGPGRHFDTVLQGRRTWQVGADQGLPNAYPHLRNVVFTRSPGAVAGPGLEVVAGDPLAHVRALKEQPGGGIWLCGGGALAARLLPEIDGFVLKLNPVLLGRGVPLVDGEVPAPALERTAARDFPSGVSWLSYRPVRSPG